MQFVIYYKQAFLGDIRYELRNWYLQECMHATLEIYKEMIGARKLKLYSLDPVAKTKPKRAKITPSPTSKEPKPSTRCINRY